MIRTYDQFFSSKGANAFTVVPEKKTDKNTVPIATRVVIVYLRKQKTVNLLFNCFTLTDRFVLKLNYAQL